MIIKLCWQPVNEARLSPIKFEYVSAINYFMFDFISDVFKLWLWKISACPTW